MRRTFVSQSVSQSINQWIVTKETGVVIHERQMQANKLWHTASLLFNSSSKVSLVWDIHFTIIERDKFVDTAHCTLWTVSPLYLFNVFFFVCSRSIKLKQNWAEHETFSSSHENVRAVFYSQPVDSFGVYKRRHLYSESTWCRPYSTKVQLLFIV